MRYNDYELQNLVKIRYGKNQKKVVSEKGKYPIYGTGGLMGYSTEYLYDKPSVLIGRKGTINKVKYIEEPFWTVDTLFYTEVDEEVVIPKYLYYLMSLINFNNYNEGTTIPSLRTENLNRIVLNIPTIDYQKKVLSILNPIDEKIENNNKINKNLFHYALCLYSKLIEGQSKKNFIGDYCTLKSGFAFKSKWWKKSGIPVVKIGSINQDYLNLLDCSFVSEDKISFAKDFIVSEGDLIIAMTGATIGKFTMVPKYSKTILVNQRVGKFFLGDKPINRIPFIYCTLKQPDIFSEIINRGQGSAQPNVSAKDIMTIPCVMPESSVINQFNRKLSPMFEMITNNQFENLKLSKLKNTLLPKLISGEIDVSSIDL